MERPWEELWGQPPTPELVPLNPYTADAILGALYPRLGLMQY